MDSYIILDITSVYNGFLSDYWRIALLQNENDKSHIFSLYLEPHAENEASGVVIKKNGEYDLPRISLLREQTGKALDSWKKDDIVSLF